MENLIERLRTLLDEGGDFDRAAAAACRSLRAGVRRFNWVGIYMIEGGDTLVLKAWDGPAPTEHVRIPIGQGICGLAARENRTVVVDDVRADPRYLQCFLHTRAEIVVPIRVRGAVAGEIDIDSDTPAAFGETDAILLEWLADRLGRTAERGRPVTP